MKKVLAVILITVMIAALVPITSVATENPVTYTYLYDSAKAMDWGWWVGDLWEDGTSHLVNGANATYEKTWHLSMPFTTPSAFSGCFLSIGLICPNTQTAAVTVDLYDAGGKLVGSAFKGIGATGSYDAVWYYFGFDEIFASGSYTLSFTIASPAVTAMVIFGVPTEGQTLPAGVSIGAVTTDCYVHNSPRTPAILLMEAEEPVPTTGQSDPDVWLVDVDTVNAFNFPNQAYWMNQMDAGQFGAHAYKLRTTFISPSAFDGFFTYIEGPGTGRIRLIDEYGNVDANVYNMPGGGVFHFKFSKAYAPGKYTLELECDENASQYLVWPTGAAADNVESWTYADANRAGNYETPFIKLDGAVNPDPGAVAPAKDADYWLCDSSASPSTGWWLNGSDSYAEFTFETPNAFDGIYTYIYRASQATVRISVYDYEKNELCESFMWRAHTIDDYTTIKFSRTYAPGKYTVRIDTTSFNNNNGLHFVVGSAPAAAGAPVMINGTAGINENTKATPYIKLIGAANSGATFTKGVDQNLSTGAIAPGWPMVFENQGATNQGGERYIDIKFIADDWFGGFAINSYGAGIVNVKLLKNGSVLEQLRYQSLIDRATDETASVRLFRNVYAPGEYTIRIEDTETTSTEGNPYYFYLAGRDAPADSSVNVTSNVSDNGHTNAPAIKLLGSKNYDRFTNINATLTDGNLVNLNFKADAMILAYSDNAAEDYVTFAYGEESKNVTGVDNGNGQYVFNLPGLTVEELDKPITATLHRKVGGTEKTVELISGYTAKKYFETLINDPAQGAKIKALATATLNYGAAAQAYTTATPSMTPVDQTEFAAAIAERKATLTSVKALDGTNVVNKLASWTAVGLKLEDEVSIRYTFKLLDTSVASSAKIYFTYGTTEKTVDLSDLTSIGNNVYVYYLPMPANLLSETVTAVIKNGSDEISSRFTYSVESYAYAKKDDADTTLADLVTAMMIYGDAAKAYVANPDD